MAIKRLVDPVLTALATGYSNNQFVGSILFPRVDVSKEGGKIPQFGKEAFYLYNTERALRAKSNRINPEGVKSVGFTLEEHDIEYPIDYRESDGEMDLPIEQNAVNTTMDIITLRLEHQQATLATNPANYSASNKIALSGTSKFDVAGSDPIAIIEAGKKAVRAKIGKRPNSMVLAAAVYDVLKEHPALIEKIKYAQEGIITVDMMQKLFGIANIQIGEAVYATDNGEFHDVWGTSIVLAYTTTTKRDLRSYLEPTFGYTLGKKGYPQVDKRNEDGKVSLPRTTDIFEAKIVGADAGYLITNAVS